MNLLKKIFLELFASLSGGFEREQKLLLQKTSENPILLTIEDVGRYFRVLSVDGIKMKVIECKPYRKVYKNAEHFFQLTKTGNEYITLTNIGLEYYVAGVSTNSIGIMKIEIEHEVLIGKSCRNCIHEDVLSFSLRAVPRNELLMHF